MRTGRMRFGAGSIFAILLWCSAHAAPGAAAADAAFTSDKPNVIPFEAAQARFVRLQLLAHTAPAIDELEIYGPAGDTNLALASNGSKATASSCITGYPIHQIVHLNDGKYGNPHSWVAGASQSWVQIELPKAVTVNRVAFARDREGKHRDRLPTGVEVRLSADGETWKTVATMGVVRPLTATPAPPTPPPADVKEVKEPEPNISAAPPQPVPNAALLPEAETLVRDFFRADYGRPDVADRERLAKRLIAEAAQTNTDLDLKYVLLREAYDIARNSGQFELAMVAVKEMTRAFQVDGARLRSDIFTKVSPSTPEGQQALLDCILSELEGAAADDRYGEALQLLALAKGWAVKLKDSTLQTRLTTQAKDLSAGQAAFEKHEAAQQTLAGKPDDAAAHLAVGTYLCFHKQNWKTGLSHLAHGADPVLKDAASRELKKPTEATEQADLGDLWWLQAEKETGPAKGVMQQRAIVWYAEALADLPPARQAVVMKRLQTGAGSSDAVLNRIKAAGLVFFVHPAMDPTGKARDLITFAPPTHVGTVTEVAETGVKALKFASSYAKYPASEAVRAVTTTGSFFVWIKHPPAAAAWAGVIFRGTAPDPNIGKGVADFSLFIYQDHFRFWLNWPENEWPGVEGKSAFVSKNTVPAGRWTMLGGTWNGTAIVLYMDGQRDRAFESTMTPLPRKFPEMVALGCDPAGSPEYYNGLISCAMIFNKALTDAEVKQLHALSGPLGLVGN